MKQKIIDTIRAVPIAGKTYEEYTLALADKLQNSEFEIRNAELRVAREIFAEIENIAMHGATPYGLCLMSMGEAAFAELKKKYTESEK